MLTSTPMLSRKGRVLCLTAALLAGCTLACSSSALPESPAELRRFPNQTCAVKQLEFDIKAELVPDPQGLDAPSFVISVCVACDGTPVIGVSGIQARLESPPDGTPPNARHFGFPRTNEKGCSTVAFRSAVDELAGTGLLITLSDTDRKPIDVPPVTIVDTR